MTEFAKTSWNENGHLIADDFGDVYFSVEGGLAETNYIFLEKNNLPQAWQDKTNFTIIETGFGTGLNFLALCILWQKTTTAKQKLHFISVEKYPLSENVFKKSLSQYTELIAYKTKLDNAYTDLIKNKINTVNIVDNISITLLIGDVNDVISNSPAKADAWFLDGFSPAKNPEMWNEELYNNMVKFSNNGATFATFTSAGHVRRGLKNAGFDVELIKGFGKKRHMLNGKLPLITL